MDHQQSIKLAREITDALAAKFRLLDPRDMLPPKPGEIYQVVHRALTQSRNNA